MSARRAEAIVVWTMRILAATFALVGILFIAAPDGVIESLERSGELFGAFAAAPETDLKLWLGLGFAYMMVITALAFVVQLDVARFRPLLLVLAIGKAASSLAALGFFLFDRNVYAYLLNFVVDGGLVLVALGCWVLAGRVERSPAVTRGQPSAAG